MNRKLFIAFVFLAVFLAALVACETVPEQAEDVEEPAVTAQVAEPVIEPVVEPAPEPIPVSPPVAEREAARIRRDAIIDYRLQTYNQQAFDSGEESWDSGEADYERDNDSALAYYLAATASYDYVIEVALAEIETEKVAQVNAARELADERNARQNASLLYRRAISLVNKAIESRDADRPVAAVTYADRARDAFLLAATQSRRLTIGGMRAEAEEKRTVIGRYNLSGYDPNSYRSAESNYRDGVNSVTSDAESAWNSFLAAIEDYDEVIDTAIDRIVAEKTTEVQAAWDEAVRRDAENRTPVLFDRSRVLIRRAISARNDNQIVVAVVLANRARNSLLLASRQIVLDDERARLAAARAMREERDNAALRERDAASLRERAQAAFNSAEQSIRGTESRAIELLDNYNSEFNTNIDVNDINIGDIE